MNRRLNPYQAAPEAMKALMSLENYVQQSGLDHSLIDLVKTRASQMNGCAYCICCFCRTRHQSARPNR